MFPYLFNFQNVNLIDILTFLATTALGVGAILTGISANRIAKISLKTEANMRKLENNISLSDKVFEVYNFFNKEISQESYFSADNPHSERIYEIYNLSKYVFREEIYNRISDIIVLILKTQLLGNIPKIQDSKKVFKDKAELNAAFDFTCKVDEEDYFNRKMAFLESIRVNVDDIFKEYSLKI